MTDVEKSDLSYEIGALSATVRALTQGIKEFKEVENARHDVIDRKLDILVTEFHERKGVLKAIKTTASIWGAVLGAVVVGVLEFLKFALFGGR
jgi:tetrahydromethanopterin S-methyltransferase subunit G